MGNKKRRLGETLSHGPPEGEPWYWQTKAMLGAITYRALGISARRILDFALYEHMSHGGKENGNLALPYEALGRWGVTGADTRKGFAEVFATGFLVRTREGFFTLGGRTPARYRLTWLPTGVWPGGGPATHEWIEVLDRLGKAGVGSVAQAKCWLRAEVETFNRSKPTGQKQKLAPHLKVVRTSNEGRNR
ncbi:MAG: hypothetical protein IM624_04000 [Phenylobacterium sp.]|jgi:hypothetical protein|uniref:hypothetical protein n=1 Tax=Phenylobacterium sp. TaxID=1871053 RepID=UPI0025EBC95A|nr:hypothetical protein [Phenylobacterium sp.]MCA6298345.1 hypothetical protein [Phenylobacterium sp.]